jgi:DNA-binding transcriptional MerR regulator
MASAVKSNYRVFIPGKDWVYKDLNEARQDGLSIQEIQEYVEKSSFTGLRLNLNFNKWKSQ